MHGCDDTRAEEISLLISQKVTGDLLPLGFVEEEGFRELMAFVEPEYKPHPRKKRNSYRSVKEVGRGPNCGLISNKSAWWLL